MNWILILMTISVGTFSHDVAFQVTSMSEAQCKAIAVNSIVLKGSVRVFGFCVSPTGERWLPPGSDKTGAEFKDWIVP